MAYYTIINGIYLVIALTDQVNASESILHTMHISVELTFPLR